jgi:putative hydrolase of the HAD superfamily
MRFRAVFFDAGETLVHPTPSFPELFSLIVAREGHRRSPEEVTEASRVVLERFSAAATAETLWTISPDRSRAFWLDVYGRMLASLGLAGTDGLRDVLYREFTDLRNYALFDDVADALASIEASGATLGIISNFEAWLDDLLMALHVRDAFPVRVISGHEGIEKPDPRIFQRALERARVEPNAAAYVGDNPEFDVDPPAALGIFPVLIDRRGRHEGWEGPGTRITHLDQLADALEAAG